MFVDGICVVVEVLVYSGVVMFMLVILIEDVDSLFDLNVVKVVCCENLDVLYFSCVLILWYCDVFV